MHLCLRHVLGYRFHLRQPLHRRSQVIDRHHPPCPDRMLWKLLVITPVSRTYARRRERTSVSTCCEILLAIPSRRWHQHHLSLLYLEMVRQHYALAAIQARPSNHCSLSTVAGNSCSIQFSTTPSLYQRPIGRLLLNTIRNAGF